jgi:hypothetical protein
MARVTALGGKVGLAAHIVRLALAVHLGTRRHPLPEFVASFADVPPTRRRHRHVRTLRRAVDRVLGTGPKPSRCLVRALVLFRLLREQGDEPALVIGLPHQPTGERAHAWVELGGVDVGPSPGSRGFVELARYS